MIQLRAPLSILALSLGLIASGCSGGSGGGDKQGGKVTPLALACPSGAGSIANTSCQYLKVASQGNPDINVELRVTEPDALAVQLGTAVLSSGGPGGEFYAEQGGGDLLVQALSDAGWRVVDRKWEGGWIEDGPSVKQQSRRYALLLDWIDKHVHQGGDLVVTGNSGGSAEIAYTLTTWKQGKLIDTAVLTGGPVFTRIDYLCATYPPAAWAAQCPSFVPPGALVCGTPECTRPTSSVCGSATPAELLEDSILHPGAVIDFGETHVHVAIGDGDCTPGPPQGLLFESLVVSPTSVEFVPGTPHALMSTQAGRDAIVAALVNYSLPAPAAPPTGPLVRERITILDDRGPAMIIDRAGRRARD